MKTEKIEETMYNYYNKLNISLNDRNSNYLYQNEEDAVLLLF